MGLTAQRSIGRRLTGASAFTAIFVLTTGVLTMGRLWGQQASPQTSSAQTGSATGVAAAQGVVLDRLVAVVNGDVILESDVDEERRFEEIQPYRAASDSTRARIIERLVDRALILQQAVLQPEDAVSDQELGAQIATLRKDIPACRQYHCETDEGWKKFLADHGFTVEEFSSRWRQRMQLLKFIEVRFRNGVSIKDDEIQTYYEKTMLPEYARRKVTPPPLDTVKRRIEEVLLQQQVTALLQDWLRSLRAQGSVRIMVPGEVAP